MIHPPAKVLAELLISLDLFDAYDDATPAWPIYISYSPDQPDEIGVVHDMPGVKDGRLMSGALIEHFGVQLTVRGEDYDDAYAKCDRVAREMEAVDDVSVLVGAETYTVHNVSQSSPILSLGKEEGTQRRFLFSMNFLLTITGE